MSAQEEAIRIDLYFDSLEWEGMPLERLLYLEIQRQKAHEALVARAITIAAGYTPV